MNTRNLLATAVVAGAFLTGVHAQTTPATSSEATAASAMADGEVRKVDKEAGKVTLKHGPLPNLAMPGMTMVFKAADPKMLDGLKEGEKVRFSAERINGAISITRIEPAK
jgi:Cu(I)/Ag(I) efflux system protein CusF